MSGKRTHSGLTCSHGSELDTKIPRPKMPKTALPPDIRKKLGFSKRIIGDENIDIWKAGSGVLTKVGSGRDGNYLKKGSGEPMSIRTSRKAQLTITERNHANISKPKLKDSNDIIEL